LDESKPFFGQNAWLFTGQTASIMAKSCHYRQIKEKA
jgi:hypothetical protein